MANAEQRQQQFTQFPHPVERSVLFVRHGNVPDRIPSVEDLGALANELKRFQALGQHRVATADLNLAHLDRLVKKMGDRGQEKAKLKNLKEKEKERARKMNNAASSARAPSLVASDAGDSMQVDIPPVASTSSAALKHRPSDGVNSKKKKRVRESLGPDEIEDPELLPPPAQKLRKTSPSPSQSHTPHPQSQPHASTSALQPTSQPQPKSHKSKSHHVSKANGDGKSSFDFTVVNRSYLPPRPKMFPPLPSGPRHVEEVADDFTQMRQPPRQEPINAFHSSVEPFMRPIREEDLAFLSLTGDPDDPFLIPALGRHYLEVWEDEDATLERREPKPGVAPPRPAPPAATTWNPASLDDEDNLPSRNGANGLGPVADRVISAMIVRPQKEELVTELDPAAAAGLSGTGEPRAPTLSAIELDARYTKELQNLGLLMPDEVLDVMRPDDDQIVSELRLCQRLLSEQQRINNERKARLLALAEDRVAYQEYLDSKESIERNLISAFQKLQKPAKPSQPAPDKKKKKSGRDAKHDEPAGPQPHPSVSGLVLSTDGLLHVPAHLKRLVDVRARWVGEIGEQLEMQEREAPGKYWGLPKRSVYESLNLPPDPDPQKKSVGGGGHGHGRK